MSSPPVCCEIASAIRFRSRVANCSTICTAGLHLHSGTRTCYSGGAKHRHLASKAGILRTDTQTGPRPCEVAPPAVCQRHDQAEADAAQQGAQRTSISRKKMNLGTFCIRARTVSYVTKPCSIVPKYTVSHANQVQRCNMLHAKHARVRSRQHRLGLHFRGL